MTKTFTMPESAGNISRLIDPVTGSTIEGEPVIFYHAKCPDGFAAALAAWIHFDGRGEYLPATHDMVVPDVAGKMVYMLDIAFGLETMDRVMAQAQRLVVLDHHQSTADGLINFHCTCGKVHFDMSKSAAKLAWEAFHPDRPVPELISMVEDRDLLKWTIKSSSEYLMALDAGPYNFHRWAGILSMPEDARERVRSRGRAMRDMANTMASQMSEHAATVVIAGEQGLLANAPFMFHNDVGARLVQRSGTFAALWCVESNSSGEPQVRVGLRSNGDFDVIPLAKAFGGGGHENSSAFRLPISRLADLLSGNLESCSPKLRSSPGR